MPLMVMGFCRICSAPFSFMIPSANALKSVASSLPGEWIVLFDKMGGNAAIDAVCSESCLQAYCNIKNTEVQYAIQGEQRVMLPQKKEDLS